MSNMMISRFPRCLHVFYLQSRAGWMLFRRILSSIKEFLWSPLNVCCRCICQKKKRTAKWFNMSVGTALIIMTSYVKVKCCIYKKHCNKLEPTNWDVMNFNFIFIPSNVCLYHFVAGQESNLSESSGSCCSLRGVMLSEQEGGGDDIEQTGCHVVIAATMTDTQRGDTVSPQRLY